MLKITSRGIPELQAWLLSLANGVKDEATRSVAEYLVGDSSHGLKHYPPYKYISMQRAYGGFISDKQRRYVMAMIKEGKIRPGQDNRTGNLSANWEYKAQGGRYTITNDTPYAKYVQGGQQSNMHNLIGWRQTLQTVKDNLAGAYRHANANIKKWLAGKRRG